jgi:precorrin-6B methylase 2
MSYLAVSDHRSMALDAIRNAAYGRALRQAIDAETVVLDLGAGTGIHGLMAARLGAKRVYLVEPEDIIAVAAENVRANGLTEVIQCVQGRIEDVTLPEPVNLIVSVLTGNFLLAEDLLSSLFYARDHALAPGGVLVPSRATMEVVPVMAAELHARHIAAWSVPAEGVDLSSARPFAAHTLIARDASVRDATWLADPATLAEFDFSQATDAGVHAAVSCRAETSGVCHGWAGWFRLELGDRWLSTSPRDPAVHWSPVVLPIDPPVAVERGELVSLGVDRPPSSDWTWTMRAGLETRRHSTFQSIPMTLATLTKAAGSYQPGRSAAGEALFELLGRCDGRTSVHALAEALHERYPGQFSSYQAAFAFVQHVVKQYA